MRVVDTGDLVRPVREQIPENGAAGLELDLPHVQRLAAFGKNQQRELAVRPVVEDLLAKRLDAVRETPVHDLDLRRLTRGAWRRNLVLGERTEPQASR
jgi:hypothetical protein